MLVFLFFVANKYVCSIIYRSIDSALHRESINPAIDYLHKTFGREYHKVFVVQQFIRCLGDGKYLSESQVYIYWGTECQVQQIRIASVLVIYNSVKLPSKFVFGNRIRSQVYTAVTCYDFVDIRDSAYIVPNT